MVNTLRSEAGCRVFVQITSGVVAAVWHKWFGDPPEEPAEPDARMAALAGCLQAIMR